MARKTEISPVAGSVPLTLEGEVSGFPLTPGEVAEADVKRVVAELGENTSESKVQIWRITKGERYPAYVRTYAPEMFSMERLAEDCGGGIYDVTVYVPSIEEGTGRRLGAKIATKPRVFVDGPAKVQVRPDPPAPAPAAAPERPSEIAALAAAMIAGFDKMSASIIAQSNTNRQSTVETLKELMALKSLFAQDAPKSVDEFERFERFLTMQDNMRSAIDKLPGNASDSQTLLALGRDFLKMFGKAALPAQPDPALITQGSAAVAVADPPPEPPVTQPENADMSGMDFIFKGYVKILVDNARANNDVNTLAQTIYDQAPEDFLESLFRDDKYLDRIAAYNKDVKLYPMWFDRLRARIKEIHEADNAAE